MSTGITQTRYSLIRDVPILFPQTEIRRGKQLVAAQIVLALGQMLRVRGLNLHVIRNLTPGPLPDILNTTLGIASVGVYLGPMLTSSPALVRAPTTGMFSLNAFCIYDFTTPGTYNVLVANNTDNIDLSVAVTGAMKLYE